MESFRRNQMITADLLVHVSLAGIWQSFISICLERRNKIANFSPYESQICGINIFAITSQNNHNKTVFFFFKVPTSSQDEQRTPCKKSTRPRRFITTFSLAIKNVFVPGSLIF